MLKHLSEKDSQFQQSYKSWEEAVRAAGGLMERSGKISGTYTDAMVGLVKENGPYIVVIPGVALAHARPQGNVMENSIGLVTMREGVFFGNTANDPVRAVFAIAARTDNEHLVLFREVAGFIESEENLHQLFHACRYADLGLD